MTTFFAPWTYSTFPAYSVSVKAQTPGGETSIDHVDSLPMLHKLLCVLLVLVQSATHTASVGGPVWARKLRRISPPRFLAECQYEATKNQASFVLLYFALFAFLGCVELL